jgi:hypothetical protein
VAGACECGNELSGAIKCCEYLDQLWNYQLFRKDYATWYWLVMLNIHASACVGCVCRTTSFSGRIMLHGIF